MSSSTRPSTRIFRQAVEEVRVAHFLNYRDFLRHLYKYIKKEAKPYSYIRFSEELGFGANNSLRLIIIGKRPLTEKSAVRIADAIGLVGLEKRYLVALTRFNNARRAGERENWLKKLMAIKARLIPDPIDESRLEYFSRWYHPVIRELAGRDDFEMNPKWIQTKLAFPLRVEEIKKSLELLSRLGLIYYNARANRYVCSDEQIDTGPDARGMAYVGYQQQMIELGKESITRVPKDRRELVSATLSLLPEQVEELRAKIRELMQEAATMDRMDTDDPEAVIQFNMQLFHHTRD